MPAIAVCWLLGCSGVISRYLFQLVLTNSKLNEFSVTLLRVNKKCACPVMGSGKEVAGSEPHLSAHACRAGTMGFFTPFSALPLISTEMQVEERSETLSQSYTRGLQEALNKSLCPWSIETVYLQISWQPTKWSSTPSLLLSGMLWKNIESVSGRWDHFVWPVSWWEPSWKKK